MVLQSQLIIQFTESKNNARARAYFCVRKLQLPVICAKTDHFTVACSVTFPSNDSEAVADLVLIKTSLLLLCN